jgi:ribosomal-protein-alanine N-acetyltransferase
VSPASGPDDRSGSLTDGQVAIRQAERADLLEVFRLEKATFPQPWPYSAFESFLGERGFLVATDGETILGYVVSDVTPNYGRDIGHIKDLAIRPEARRQGLGRTLLRRALRVLHAAGAVLVKLEVRTNNESAKSLYRSEGFEPLRRIPRYYENGSDAEVMVLDITEWQPTGAAEDGAGDGGGGADDDREPVDSGG